jgi:hypothetical protein
MQDLFKAIKIGWHVFLWTLAIVVYGFAIDISLALLSLKSTFGNVVGFLLGVFLIGVPIIYLIIKLKSKNKQ